MDFNFLADDEQLPGQDIWHVMQELDAPVNEVVVDQAAAQQQMAAADEEEDVWDLLGLPQQAPPAPAVVAPQAQPGQPAQANQNPRRQQLSTEGYRLRQPLTLAEQAQIAVIRQVHQAAGMLKTVSFFLPRVIKYFSFDQRTWRAAIWTLGWKISLTTTSGIWSRKWT